MKALPKPFAFSGEGPSYGTPGVSGGFRRSISAGDRKILQKLYESAEEVKDCDWQKKRRAILAGGGVLGGFSA